MYNKFKNCVNLESKYVHVENGASYYISRFNNKLYIYFEQSNGLIDWKHNFYFPAKPYRDMKDRWFCHRGFLKVWKSIEPYISEKILDPKIKFIDIVGYSHGGAIAQLCYEYVKFNRPDIKVEGIGFGAPRVFWGFAKKSVKERFKGFVVVRNGRDIVTHLPPVLFGFHHICDVVTVGECDGITGVKDHYPKNYSKALKKLKEKKNDVS